MNIEEKARAYDEALDRMKHVVIVPKDEKALQALKETIFPELRENEDERIRKGLVKLLTVAGEAYLVESTGIKKDSYLAYLEKQKENPKNADSISADCASNAKCPYKIHGDEDFIGDIKDTPAYHFGFDEGVRSEREKQKEQKPELVQQPPITYTYISNASRDERLKAALLALLNSDLLKVKEGGYFTKQDLIEWVERIPTDKPAELSEEDEEILDGIINTLDRLGYAEFCKSSREEDVEEERFYYKEIQCLKKLKSLRPQKLDASKLENFDPVDVLNRIKKEWPTAWEKVIGKQEWSEEDDERIAQLIYDTEHIRAEYEEREKELGESFNDDLIKDCDEQIAWLKALPERFNLQPKQEWSEEDEAAYTAFMCEVVNEKMNPTIEQVKWLRGIRDRLKSLRPSWKPQPESLEALMYAIRGKWEMIKPTSYLSRRLEDLYEQLKNL